MGRLNQPRFRALIVGGAGPAIQTVGLTWHLLHLAISHGGEAVTLRHIFFEPGFLLVIVGLLLSLVCLPVALQLAAAKPEDLEIPAFGVQDAEPVSLRTAD